MSDAMYTVNFHEARELVPQLWDEKLTPVLVGSPGIGKTQCGLAIARDTGREHIVTHPTVEDPTDRKGLPARSADGKSAEFLHFGDTLRLRRATKPTLWQIEDLGQAGPAVQAAYMPMLLQDGVGLNGHALSDQVRILATTNRREHGAGVGVANGALVNRCILLDFVVDPEGWQEWAVAAGINPFVMAFLQWRPDTLNQYDPALARDLRACPTPRTWEMVGKVCNMLANPATGEVTVPGPWRAVLAGSVGDGVASEFISFCGLLPRLPDFDDIFADPQSTPVPGEPDVMYAASASLAHQVDKKTFGAALTWLRRATNEYAEVFVQVATRRDPKLCDTKEFIAYKAAG